MIDPDAVYILNDRAGVTGLRFSRVVNAVQRGRLVATRNERGHYEVRGSDLIAWQDHVPTPRAFLKPVYRPVPADEPPAPLPADEIRLIRVRLGLNQTQFAHGLGYTQTIVTR